MVEHTDSNGAPVRHSWLLQQGQHAGLMTGLIALEDPFQRQPAEQELVARERFFWFFPESATGQTKGIVFGELFKLIMLLLLLWQAILWPSRR